MISFDVNVLIQALYPLHPRHAETRDWLAATIDRGPFGLSENVLSAYVRIITNRRIFPQAPNADAAFRSLEPLRRHPHHVALRPGPRNHDLFAALCREHHLRGPDVADAYHAALAIEHHCRFASYDRGFARFRPKLDWVHPGDEADAGT